MRRYCNSPKCKAACGIADAFARAERPYRATLAEFDLERINTSVLAVLNAETLQNGAAWLIENHRTQR